MLRSKNFTFEKTPDGAYYVIRHIKCGTRYANVTLEFSQSEYSEAFGAVEIIVAPWPGFYEATTEIVDLVIEEALRLSPRVWWRSSNHDSEKYTIKRNANGRIYYVDRPAEPDCVHPQDGGIHHGDDAAGGSSDVPRVQGLVDEQQPRESQSDGTAGPRDIPF